MSIRHINPYATLPNCGCYYDSNEETYPPSPIHYLPLVNTHFQTTILSTASRTRLRQCFSNDSSRQLSDVQYQFPLYDGVSVVSFKCMIGDKTIVGVVKEKNEARAQYKDAVSRGERAGLLEQSTQASDVFCLRIGNVPAKTNAKIEIVYVGELKHDAELDGVRFTIPTVIAPRYGFQAYQWQSTVAERGKIEIAIDVEVEEGSHIEGLASPSHPIQMVLGRTSTQKETFKSNLASATLVLGDGHFEQDFLVVINSKGFETPRAMLEDHPLIPGHRALMTTFVPKFNLPPIHPEIVFVVDRSGSMGDKMSTVIESLKVFLKSLPLSVKFNICSFGSSHTFLFNKSQPYDEQRLQQALNHVQTLSANYGGTELLQPIRSTVKQRLTGIPLEIMVLTDGQIWNQQELFDFVNDATTKDVRLFSLGIGDSTSTSLVEGLARAGNGFAQFAHAGEKIDKRVIRMLKAALSPHVTDCSLEVKYAKTTGDQEIASSDDDYELVDAVDSHSKEPAAKATGAPAPINLVDPNFTETSTNPSDERYDHLPKIEPPRKLQAPFQMPGLFPFNRTSTYLLLSDSKQEIESIRFRGTCNGAPLQLEIPVQRVGFGQTIHQLAAKKAMLETEEGRGWLSAATAPNGVLLKEKYEADWERIIEREAVRLGLEFQLGGKFCSFVALEGNDEESDQILSVDESGEPSTPVQGSVRFMSYPPPSPASRRGISGSEKKKKKASRSEMIEERASPPTNAPMNLPCHRSVSTPYCGALRAAWSRSAFGSAGGSSSTPSSKPSTNLFGQNSLQASFSTSQSMPQAFGQMALAQPASFGAPAMMQQQAQTTTRPGGLPPSPAARGSPGQMRRSIFQSKEAATTDSYKPQPSLTSLQTIIDRQQWSGNWNPDSTVLSAVNTTKEKFDSISLEYGNDDDQIKATIVVLAWLEKFEKHEKEVWEMMAEKAKGFIVSKAGAASVGSDVFDVNVLIQQAMSLFFA